MHPFHSSSVFIASLLLASLWAGMASAQALPLDDPSAEVELGASLESLEPAPARPPRDNSGLGLAIPGAAFTVVGGVVLVVAGFQSWDPFEDGPPDQNMIFAGSVLVALGIPLLIGGLYWLLEPHDGPRDAAATRELGVIRF